MSRRHELKKEAAQTRALLDRRTTLVHQRLDRLITKTRALAGHPAALPVAFVFGIVAGRLQMPGIKCAYGLLIGQVNGMKLAASLIDPPPR